MVYSYSQYGFWSSGSTTDLLAVVSERIAGAFNRSGPTWSVVFSVFNALTGCVVLAFYSQTQVFWNFNLGIWLCFVFFSVIDGLGRFRRSIWSMLEFLKTQFFLHFFYYIFKTFLMISYVILLSMLITILCTLPSGIWFVATTRFGFWT